MTDAAAPLPSPSDDLVRRPSVMVNPNATAKPTPTTSTATSVTSPRECCTTGSFVTKLYKMVDTEPATIVSWIRGGTAFCIVDPKMMAEHCLPKYFRHRRFSSLIRQLNFYSFYRVQEGQLTIYQHSYFRKGRPDLLMHIKRRGAGKAKDPWFDPLAPAVPKPMPMLGLSDLMIHAPMDLMTPHPMMCYSPMAKPLPVSAMDNLSPALKPAMAPMPPAVELGGKMDAMQWDVAPTPMNPTMKPMVNPSLDLDIQDFLTEECAIAPEVAATNNKRLLVARDFMKWDALDDDEVELDETTPAQDQPVDAFERELLLDLASVEPGAWDVPLSPLNVEEDMLPWSDDLCF